MLPRKKWWLSWQELPQLVLVDVVNGVASGREGDGEFGITLHPIQHPPAG